MQTPAHASNALDAAHVGIERDDLATVLHELSEMSRLASGSRTGIEHAFTWSGSGQQADDLRSLALHRE